MSTSSEERWYFTKEQLENSPSRKCGIDADKELSHRQQAANFIQDMGQRLQVTQLCINTAIVYMHRFYCFHSFSLFQRNAIASAALFLAAKVEEQPRKLEHIIKVAQLCLKGQPNTDRRSEVYQEQAQELVMNENILLMTLGFDVAIEHPHAFIVKFCHIANTSKDLSQTSYFMASNSLHLTTMCLQYKPTVVACFCIHLVCKWSNWQIPKSKENLPWYSYIDPAVTEEQLEQLTNEFLVIFDKCPSRLKKKIQNTQLSSQNPSMSNYPFEAETRKQNSSSGHQQQQSQSNSNAAAGQPSTLQHKSSNDNSQNQSAASGRNLFPPDHKKSNSVAAVVNHHHSFHSPAKPPVASIPSLSSGGASGGANNLSATAAHDNVPVGKLPNSAATAAAVSSSQTRPTSNHGSASQSSNAFGASSHPSHKSSGGVTNNGHSSASAARPKMPVATTNHGNVIHKELMQQQRADHRKPEIKPDPGIVKQEPGVAAKQEPGITIQQEPGVVPAAITTNNHHSKHNYKKGNGSHQESSSRSSVVTPGFAATSHSEIISNVVKEVAKQNEKQRTTVKSEPVDEFEKLTSLYATDATDSMKPPKSHSIFSPSPIGQSDSLKSSPFEERMETVTVKTESVTDTRKSIRTRNFSTSSGEPELIPLLTKVETIAGYEDILQKTVVSVPPAALMSPKHEFGREKKINAMPAVFGNNVSVKEEPIDVYEYAKATNGGQLSHTEESLAHEKAESSECSSHSHKKKKKHKEKDKRHDKEKRNHKEKKRHKEDKHRHRKEHSTEKDVLKEPGPIKITIPKEKLVDIPMKLKIKINKDQIATPSIVEDKSPPVAADIKLKISKEKLKSRKRNRESDHEDSSKKFAYEPSSSHNGYK